jgi:hypothetical protein
MSRSGNLFLWSFDEPVKIFTKKSNK